MAKKTPPPQNLALEGDLDVFSIHLQWEKVQPLLAIEKGSVEVDLASIGDLDLSGLQLLCALEREFHSRGIAFSVAGAKEEWRTRFTPLGLASLFGGVRS